MTIKADATDLARRIRAHSLRMCAAAQASHVGSCLSAADILAVLYADFLRFEASDPHWLARDRFILSKGHAAAALYAVLAECGFFAMELLATYCQDGSALTGHVSHHVPGVEVSTGSLGHGLPIACGLALAAQRDHAPWRVVVLLSDGELDEGSNWEAALFAGHHRLSNLIAIVDYNKIQSFGNVADVLGLEPLRDKWESFGWRVREVDGHDVAALSTALGQCPYSPDAPSIILAHTIKGRGVSFMESELAWHYRSPNPDQLQQALAELTG